MSIDTSGPVGTWYLFANWQPDDHDGYKQSVIISNDTTTPGSYVGAFINENGGVDVLDNISWDNTPQKRLLEFRRQSGDLFQWYRGKVVEGIFMGRFSHSHDSANKPHDLTSSIYHVSGWNSEYIDQTNNKLNNITPRVYEITVHLGDNYHAWLRVDYSFEDKLYVGHLKVFSSDNNGKDDEDLEYDVQITHWDGTILEFRVIHPKYTQEWYGVATGRTIKGAMTVSNQPGKTFHWDGTRAQVLSYGLTNRSLRDRTAWQERTTLQLKHLMMSGDPCVKLREIDMNLNLDPFPPHDVQNLPDDRDDDPANHPQNYRLTELQFKYTIANPYYDPSSKNPKISKNPTIERISHGYLAIPTTLPPRDKRYPAVIALNGHHGNAHKMMEPKGGKPDHNYWYGDSFARRGFVVLAIDIGHRPRADTRNLYSDDYNDPSADPPYSGESYNHSSIKAPGFDSDWAEDGERAWDAMRGLDYLISEHRRIIDLKQVAIVGLSMGGEITTIAGALDPRFTLIIPTGFSPDPHGQHHGCFLWLNANLHEYVDTSDYHALTAPRPVIIETGITDKTYSHHNPPFSSDKQVVRRSRAAYGDQVASLIHYLHNQYTNSDQDNPQHKFRVGDVNPHNKTEMGVHVPTIFEPTAPFSTEWQIDYNTLVVKPTLFDYINLFLGIH